MRMCARVGLGAARRAEAGLRLSRQRTSVCSSLDTRGNKKENLHFSFSTGVSYIELMVKKEGAAGTVVQNVTGRAALNHVCMCDS